MIRKTAAEDAFELAWFKSSYSGGNDGESCVEIALAPRAIHIRDSKTINGPRFAVAPATWTDFVTYASEG
ncbi:MULTISPECIES: DUF397 domain-containing protein [unclassified Streptomyces]|uniref:DUF397 domain-containing protein n=1 Tax=unclassified Streptomyces TaxID=2593676 RepID=UPI00190E599D|nr:MULTISPECIES: DUF397 domain-containing protein [unclassified Streptomyces]MBK3568116.1 DUF397 domain-containing protein [Streptomyces sp. MBT62]MBK6019413.1 DUF397 domain-containing protein [Streptomyces sp. MBT53]